MVVKNPIITKWDIAMDEEVKKAREDEHIRTREQTLEEAARMFVTNLRQRKMPDDEIASIVNLPIERVREIRA
ncbi:MAG: hypothetical protein LBC65_01620 [Oscillospiraceae bacterium]|nr:hypothetical protein [Oscillospiraceae bacterium]